MSDKPLSVLFDYRMADWTGVGRYTRSLARALASEPDVSLTTVVAPDGPEPPAGVRSIVATRHPFRISGAVELGRVAREARPDVIHCTHFPTPASARHPLVVTIHDLIPLTVPGVMPSRARRVAYRLWNRRATRIADAIIAVSNHTAEEVRAFDPSVAGRAHVVHEAADDFTEAPAGEIPERLSALRDMPYLLAFGNTRPHKGLPELLRAFASLADEYPDTLLVLVGKQPEGFLRGVLENPALAARVVFTGFVEDPALRALYRDCLAFVFPSHSEGFGLPPLEAMGMGAPVVTTSAASIPEVVGEAALRFEAGSVGELADVLRKVCADGALRSRLRGLGLAQASRFSWQRTAAETIAVYRRAIESREKAR